MYNITSGKLYSKLVKVSEDNGQSEMDSPRGLRPQVVPVSTGMDQGLRRDFWTPTQEECYTRGE